MKETFLKLSQNLIFSICSAAVILLTLFFLPTTTEFFEYNKFMALLILLVAGSLIWSIKMLMEKRTVITRTPLDIPIIILTIVYFIASYASIDQFVSFFGLHGKIWPSFFPLATIVAFYFLIASNLKSRKHINLVIWALIASTTAAAVVAILSYFGVYLPFDFAQLRSFNTLGVTNKLALLETLVIPLSISLSVYDKDKISRAVASVATVVIVASFILINFLPAYIGAVVSIIFLSLGALRIKLTKAQQGHVAIITVVIALFLVIRFVPQVASGTLNQWIAKKDSNLTEQQQINTDKEKSIPQSAAWDIAAQSIGKRPVFGTGPGTYLFLYTQLKPRYVNSTDDWTIRFDKSASEFTEIVATLGILGILAYLLVIVAVLRFIQTLIFKSQHTIVYLPLAASIIGYIVSNFFITSSFATTSIFLIMVGLLSVLAKSMNEENDFDVTFEISTLKNRLSWLPLGMPGEDPLIKTEQTAKGAKSQILPAIFTLVVIATAALALNYQINAYRADYFYRQALLASRTNDGNRTVAFTQKALSINPRVDTYHRFLSQITLSAAINLSQQKNLTDSQKQLLGQLAQVSIDQAKAASGYQILPLRLPGISAANVANWETLAAAYQATIGAFGGADVHATNTLAQAVALDPQNPLLHNRLGSLYEKLGNTDLAQRKYEDAIIVKGDFGPAHYNLALLLIAKKAEIPRIVDELSFAKRFLPPNDPATSDLDKKLEDYNKQLRDLQEKAAAQQKDNAAAAAAAKPGASPSPSPSPSLAPSPTPKGTPEPSPTF